MKTNSNTPSPEALAEANELLSQPSVLAQGIQGTREVLARALDRARQAETSRDDRERAASVLVERLTAQRDEAGREREAEAEAKAVFARWHKEAVAEALTQRQALEQAHPRRCTQMTHATAKAMGAVCGDCAWNELRRKALTTTPETAQVVEDIRMILGWLDEYRAAELGPHRPITHTETRLHALVGEGRCT